MLVVCKQMLLAKLCVELSLKATRHLHICALT